MQSRSRNWLSHNHGNLRSSDDYRWRGNAGEAALVDSLRFRQVEPLVLDRAKLDVIDFAGVMATVEKEEPTLILNCAAHTKVDLCEEQEDLATQINGNAPGVLAAAAKDVGAKFVHYSTDFVFGENSPGQKSTRPWQPDDPTGPLSAYGRSKIAGRSSRGASREAVISSSSVLRGSTAPVGRAFR